MIVSNFLMFGRGYVDVDKILLYKDLQILAPTQVG